MGKKETIVIAKSDRLSKISYLDYNTLDYPDVGITNLTYPIEISFNKNCSISFILNKLSYSIPKNVEIILLQNDFSEKWSLTSLDSNSIFNIDLNSRTLHEGGNDFKIIVNYEDDNNKKYETRRYFSITLAKLSFPQKIISLLYSIELWLESLF